MFKFYSLGWLSVNTETQISSTWCPGSQAVGITAIPSTPATWLLLQMSSTSLLLKMTAKLEWKPIPRSQNEIKPCKCCVRFYTFSRPAKTTTYIQYFKIQFQKYCIQVTELGEKAMAPHSSTLAWKIPQTEEPCGLQSMGSRRVGYHWATSLSLFTFMHWRRKWQPTPVFLPGESQDGGAWWAAIYGVAQSRTRLKPLSSSSSSNGARRGQRGQMKGKKFSSLTWDNFVTYNVISIIVFLRKYFYINFSQLYWNIMYKNWTYLFLIIVKLLIFSNSTAIICTF